MRVDYNGRAETIFQNNVDNKGSDMVAAKGASAEKNALVTDTPYRITAATVEKALFSLESELDRIREDASQIDVSFLKDQMAILSGLLSGTEGEGLSEEGYTLNGTQVDTIVTVVDKIKLELAKGGMDINIFGDELSMEQLEAMTGSTGQAVAMAEDLRECTKEDMVYLVGKELPPTIENLYLAQHSGNGRGVRDYQMPEDENLKNQMARVIEEAGLPVNESTMGYGELLLAHDIPLTAENLAYMDKLNHMKLPPQADWVKEAISTAVHEGRKPEEAYLMEGYSLKDRALKAQEVVEQAREEDLEAVVRRGEPVTIHALEQAHRENTQVQRKEGAAGRSVGAGQTDGGTGVTSEVKVSGRIVVEAELKIVTARRQLEEIRLTMTVEASYHLLKRGFSIETEELSRLVEELKGIEENYYKTLLEQAGVPGAKEAAPLFQETMAKTEALKGFPAYAMGRISVTQTSLEVIYQEGSRLKVTMEQANMAYETMMTTPRRDLGDSLAKAFGNVDDILKELELEASPANQRAVRILAYNQMEINVESITTVKGLDEKMQNLFDHMKPAVVLEMIREGVHPLEMDVASLQAKVEEIESRLDPGQEEKYSKFLWELEQSHDITPQEKESYIGIYRLLRQIEKTDGAVIGAVLNQGGQLSLKNLLSAVRTRQRAGMDVTLTEDSGTVEVKEPKDAIHRQIDAAYQTDCAKNALEQLNQQGPGDAMARESWQEWTPEQLLWRLREQEGGNPWDAQNYRPNQEEQPEGGGARLSEAYWQQQRELMERGRSVEDAALRMLADYELPMDTYNMLAASRMRNQRNGMFQRLFSPGNQEEAPDLARAKEQILEKFAEAVKTPEDMAKAQQALAETAEHIMEGMINDREISSLDVRELKVLRSQIQISSRMSREENYAVPVLIADELTNVQLKIVRGKKTRGMVDIFFENERLGKVAARLQATEKRVEGFVAADRQETFETLKSREQDLARELSDGGQELRFDFVCQETVSLSVFSRTKSPEGEAREQEDYRVQTGRLYGMARSFLETVKELFP